MLSRSFTLAFILLVCHSPSAQVQDSIPPQVRLYKVKPTISVPLITAGIYFSQRQLNAFREKPPLTQLDLDLLDPDNVPRIDRWGLRQDPAKAQSAERVSDILFISGQLLPFTLFAFNEYRREWLDISLMYLEAQMVQGMIYSYAPFGPIGSDRKRPRVYYEEVEFSERTNSNSQNSLFSGHVSTAATGFFFFSKMVIDHNPHLSGGQKFLIYGAATIPSVATAIFRVKSLFHFPTDTAIGLGVGALSGILVPEFHRWWQRKHDTMALLSPFSGSGVVGLNFSLQF